MPFEDYKYGKLVHDNYKPRVIENLVFESLEDFGAVCIEGAKYCGKTWLAQAFSNSEINLMDPAGNFQNLEIATADPATAIAGLSPRLIDEWQEAPLLWDAVRNAVDESGKQRSFLLTGSSVEKKHHNNGKSIEPKHSGVGRIQRLRMRPMSLFESGESSGEVSLGRLFEGEIPSAQADELRLGDLCELAVRGGWPAMVGQTSIRAQRVARSYVREVCRRDINRVDDVERDAAKVERLLHSLARNAEQATKNKTIIGDMTETKSEAKLSPDTVSDYLQALCKIFIVEEIGSWSPNLRSAARINKKPKYHFVDPSIPAAILKSSAVALENDLQTFGFIFECMCLRDILVYAQAIDAQVYYYRDQASLEVDVIVEACDGRWAGIEVKLGHNKADEAASNLLSLKQKILTAGGKDPAFLAVVEGLGRFAYMREDGVLVVPINTLGI